jgi:TPR repeat protein
MLEVGTWLLAEGDLDSARLWLKIAAAAGVVSAMINLGSALINSGDREEARTWWQRAVREGGETEKELAKLALRTYFRHKWFTTCPSKRFRLTGRHGRPRVPAARVAGVVTTGARGQAP